MLPEERRYWDEKSWTEEECLYNAAGGARNRDEFAESGYVADKRVLFTLADPKKESKTLDEPVQRLKEIYDRQNS